MTMARRLLLDRAEAACSIPTSECAPDFLERVAMAANAYAQAAAIARASAAANRTVGAGMRAAATHARAALRACTKYRNVILAREMYNSACVVARDTRKRHPDVFERISRLVGATIPL